MGASPVRRGPLSLGPSHRAYIGMGGNVGDVAANVRSALRGLNALPGSHLEAVSSLYQSKPVDASGADYFNAVVALQSALGPQELLSALLALELAHDRQRPYHHAPRTLDLDLLWYGGARRASASLTLPHPRLMQRAFVLEPLVEVLAALDPKAHVHGLLSGWPNAAARADLVKNQGIQRLDGVLWPE